MAGVKFIVIYPRPTDIEAFEKVYQDKHVPMAVEKLVGKTKFVATKVVGSPQGTPPVYRIAEIHFPVDCTHSQPANHPPDSQPNPRTSLLRPQSLVLPSSSLQASWPGETQRWRRMPGTTAQRLLGSVRRPED
jgi:uncharacterized protein (TIGR02118 family)